MRLCLRVVRTRRLFGLFAPTLAALMGTLPAGCKRVPKHQAAPREPAPPPVPVVVRREEPAPRPPRTAPGPLPARRTFGDLTVLAQPVPSDGQRGLRLRSQTNGALSKGSTRDWSGPVVPAFVALGIGTQELFLLDEVDDGWLAFYRDPYGAGSCDLGTVVNCAFTARLYDLGGGLAWTLPLGPLLSRPERLEVQDIRYARGVLLLNEACQGFSRESGGKCSALVAIDPVRQAELWRTPPLHSNNQFLVLPDADLVVCGYGFSDEDSFVSLVRFGDGAVLQRVKLERAHESFTLEPPDVLHVIIAFKDEVRFAIDGLGSGAPRLRALP